VLKVEQLMPERNVVDASALSPAARLATMWVEAMAANTIGGSMAEDAELRTAQEEVRRAQSVWEKIGYVPDSVRVELSKRFQQACARILGRSPATPQASDLPGNPARPRRTR